jgi:hypothetical protein
MKRLEPYKKGGGCWEGWVKAAYLTQTNLSAIGFYKCPDTNKYISFGAACTEVEIDCLTGDHTVSIGGESMTNEDICIKHFFDFSAGPSN